MEGGGERLSGEVGHSHHLSYSYFMWEGPVWVIRKISSDSQTLVCIRISCKTC